MFFFFPSSMWWWALKFILAVSCYPFFLGSVSKSIPTVSFCCVMYVWESQYFQAVCHFCLVCFGESYNPSEQRLVILSSMSIHPSCVIFPWLYILIAVSPTSVLFLSFLAVSRCCFMCVGEPRVLPSSVLFLSPQCHIKGFQELPCPLSSSTKEFLFPPEDMTRQKRETNITLWDTCTLVSFLTYYPRYHFFHCYLSCCSIAPLWVNFHVALFKWVFSNTLLPHFFVFSVLFSSSFEFYTHFFLNLSCLLINLSLLCYSIFC